MLQRFNTQKAGSWSEANLLVANRLYQEFLMNRTFSLIALQSAVAAAILVAAPLVNAESWTEPQVAAPTASTVTRAEVRQAAIEALQARQRVSYSGETAGDLTSVPFVSTVSQAQVRAEAVEATRLGVNSNYEGTRVITPAQLAQIREAGLRAAQAQDMVVAAKR